MTTHAHPRPWHAGSLFTAGPRRPFTRDQRRVWTARLELHRRARAITALHVEIGRALLRRLGEDGRLDPAHDTIADDAGCCPRTVREALRRLNRLGMVSWLRRLVRTRLGARQDSNSYIIHLGDAPPVIRCEGRTHRETRLSQIPLLTPPNSVLLPEPAAAREALARIAQERMAVLMRKGTRR